MASRSPDGGPSVCIAPSIRAPAPTICARFVAGAHPTCRTAAAMGGTAPGSGVAAAQPRVRDRPT